MKKGVKWLIVVLAIIIALIIAEYIAFTNNQSGVKKSKVEKVD